jgi:hypothetical protein
VLPDVPVDPFGKRLAGQSGCAGLLAACRIEAALERRRHQECTVRFRRRPRFHVMHEKHRGWKTSNSSRLPCTPFGGTTTCRTSEMLSRRGDYRKRVFEGRHLPPRWLYALLLQSGSQNSYAPAVCAGARVSGIAPRLRQDGFPGSESDGRGEIPPLGSTTGLRARGHPCEKRFARNSRNIFRRAHLHANISAQRAHSSHACPDRGTRNFRREIYSNGKQQIELLSMPAGRCVESVTISWVSDD